MLGVLGDSGVPGGLCHALLPGAQPDWALVPAGPPRQGRHVGGGAPRRLLLGQQLLLARLPGQGGHGIGRGDGRVGHRHGLPLLCKFLEILRAWRVDTVCNLLLCYHQIFRSLVFTILT